MATSVVGSAGATLSVTNPSDPLVGTKIVVPANTVSANVTFTVTSAPVTSTAGLPAGAADGVISRAFSSLADFVRLSAHLLAEDGALYAMKGVQPVDELAALPAGWRVAETHALQVPGLDAERHLLVIRRA